MPGRFPPAAHVGALPPAEPGRLGHSAGRCIYGVQDPPLTHSKCKGGAGTPRPAALLKHVATDDLAHRTWCPWLPLLSMPSGCGTTTGGCRAVHEPGRRALGRDGRGAAAALLDAPRRRARVRRRHLRAGPRVPPRHLQRALLLNGVTRLFRRAAGRAFWHTASCQMCTYRLMFCTIWTPCPAYLELCRCTAVGSFRPRIPPNPSEGLA